MIRSAAISRPASRRVMPSVTARSIAPGSDTVILGLGELRATLVLPARLADAIRRVRGQQIESSTEPRRDDRAVSVIDGDAAL
jgi:hypothetical protein